MCRVIFVPVILRAEITLIREVDLHPVTRESLVRISPNANYLSLIAFFGKAFLGPNAGQAQKCSRM